MVLDLAVLVCFSPIAWYVSGLVVQGAKPRSARSVFQRPLLGRWSFLSVKRLRAIAEHGPDAVLPRAAASLSYPHLLAVSAVAIASVFALPPVLASAGPYTEECTLNLSGDLFAAEVGSEEFDLEVEQCEFEAENPEWQPVSHDYSTSPDMHAFRAGVQLMVFVAMFSTGALLVLNWIIKTMRGSD